MNPKAITLMLCNTLDYNINYIYMYYTQIKFIMSVIQTIIIKILVGRRFTILHNFQ